MKCTQSQPVPKVLVISYSDARSDESVSMTISALENHGAKVYRLEIDRFPSELRLAFVPLTNRITISGPEPEDTISLSEISSIWHRSSWHMVGNGLSTEMEPELRELALKESRTALRNAVDCVGAYEVDPFHISLAASNKPLQLQVGAATKKWTHCSCSSKGRIPKHVLSSKLISYARAGEHQLVGNQ